MKRTMVNRQILVTSGLLLLALALFELTNIDLLLQDRLFLEPAHHWLVDAKDPVWRFLLYDGIKAALIILGIGVLSSYIASFRSARLRPLRRRLLILLLAMAFVPLLIAGLKDFTNVYCPYQLARYDGDKPYVKVFESYPQGFQQTDRGRGFPAGHASGGFALMALYFFFRQKQHRLTGWLFGFGIGWAMGLYQMARGAHFLSHTIVTMLGAWLIILVLYRLMGCEEDADKTEVHSV
jgi:membrane-associated PAP2 superfamily phosphatase